MTAALEYCNEIWNKRYFWSSLVWVDLRRRYRRSWLGIGWSLMHPIIMTVVFCSVFCQLFGQDVRDYAPFVLSGLAFWNFISGVTGDGCQSFYASEHYIRQHPAPLAIYPLRTTLGMGLHFLMALCVLLVMVWAIRGPSNLATLWALVPALALLFMMGWSVAICLGVVNVVFPDMQHLVQVGLQVLFYTTPVFYSAKLLEGHGVDWLVRWNPLAAALDLIRDPILNARLPSAHAWGVAGLATMILGTIAAWILSRVERRLIFHL
ncbi:MAG TPA: ABC transporter permease [Pirellulales bacterium]|jgi:ABC-type polysaccharide/polyol phosphate export permease|nr:ABC transporter permease [Pirellulales bacterium]